MHYNATKIVPTSLNTETQASKDSNTDFEEIQKETEDVSSKDIGESHEDSDKLAGLNLIKADLSIEPVKADTSEYVEDPSLILKTQMKRRYYIESIISCYNCLRTGHLASQCPDKDKYCRMCGQLAHNASECTMTSCKNCGQIGHADKDCEMYNTVTKCRLCDKVGHSSSVCSKLWRKYVMARPKLKVPSVLPTWCYNCGSSSHFGDLCPNLRAHDNATAFSTAVAPYSKAHDDQVDRFFHACFRNPILSSLAPETAAVDPIKKPGNQRNSRPANKLASHHPGPRPNHPGPYDRPPSSRPPFRGGNPNPYYRDHSNNTQARGPNFNNTQYRNQSNDSSRSVGSHLNEQGQSRARPVPRGTPNQHSSSYNFSDSGKAGAPKPNYRH
ncbi:hypothetical protein DSO57_1011525 [Entomophthora muscae]|nr:hypothetical protein DSO57_1011525 [Entomophthora muscae]